MTAQRVCAFSDLEQDAAIRVEVDGVAIAVVLDSAGVVLGFLAEIVQKIGVADLEAELFAAIEEELATEVGR